MNIYRPSPNQRPEDRARDRIDQMLAQAGWVVQDKNKINFNAGLGIVVREYPTEDGKPADYVLFVDRKPVGVIQAKREEEGHRLTIHEEQAEYYAKSRLILRSRPEVVYSAATEIEPEDVSLSEMVLVKWEIG